MTEKTTKVNVAFDQERFDKFVAKTTAKQAALPLPVGHFIRHIGQQNKLLQALVDSHNLLVDSHRQLMQRVSKMDKEIKASGDGDG